MTKDYCEDFAKENSDKYSIGDLNYYRTTMTKRCQVWEGKTIYYNEAK